MTIRTSDSIAAISPAFIACQAAMPSVPKKTKGQVGNAVRFYSDLATVIETVQPVLGAHGLGYLQGCSNNDRDVCVTTRLLHTSGEWFEDTLGMPVERSNAQAVGSAISYAKRYALVAILGLSTDDDDGATASKPPARRLTAAANAPQPARTRVLQDPSVDDLLAAMGGGDAAAYAAEEAAGFVPATDKQIQKIQILMKDHGDRATKLAHLSALVGRELGSSKELTKAEAGGVIEHLEHHEQSA